MFKGRLVVALRVLRMVQYVIEICRMMSPAQFFLYGKVSADENNDQ